MKNLDIILSEGGALEALLEAKKDGKIGHIGLTCHSLEVLWHRIRPSFLNSTQAFTQRIIRICSPAEVLVTVSYHFESITDRKLFLLNYILKRRAILDL